MTLAIFAAVMTVVFSVLVFQQRSLAVQSDRAELRNSLRHGIEVLETELKNAGSGLPSRTPVRLPAGWADHYPVLLVSGQPNPVQAGLCFLGRVPGRIKSADLVGRNNFV